MENKHFPFVAVNIIDKQFKEALKPLIFAQNILLFPKFFIRDRRISPLDRTCVQCVFGVLLILSMRIYRSVCMIFMFQTSIGTNAIVLILFNHIFGGLGTIFSHIINAIQSRNTVKILLNLQSALRSIKLEKSVVLNGYKFWNIVNVCCMFIGYVIYTAAIAIANEETEPGYSFLFSYTVSMIFDFNMILVTRFVSLTASVLDVWNRKMILNVESDSKIMLFAYKNIVKAFCLCKNVYQFGIFNHVSQTFFHCLVSMQLFLEFAKYDARKVDFDITRLLRGVVYFGWTVKNFLLLVNLSAACEKFKARMREAQMTCARAAAGGESDAWACKNVLRLSHAAGPLSPFGLFAVDAAFPLRLVSALAAYIVVLLQFALL